MVGKLSNDYPICKAYRPASVADLIEERDGGLWLAASTGIAHLPASVRFPKLKPPRVQLIDLFINGQRVSSTMSRHMYRRDAIRLSYGLPRSHIVIAAV